MRKGVREKTEVPVKILVNSTRETNILARENFYKNVPVKSQKCAWKNFIDLGKLYSYIQFPMGYQIIFCHWVEKVEKKYKTGQKMKFLPVKLDFYPWKKTKRVPVKKKEGVKKTEKSVRENIVLPVKKPKNAKKNGFHGHFWVSRKKKKNTG